MTLVNYTSIKIIENSEPLIDLKTIWLIVEPIYFQRGLAKDSKVLLRKEVAEKLLNIESKLKGFRLKIWDGFRSHNTQENIYIKYRQEVKTNHPDWNDEEIKVEVGKFVSPAYQKDRIPPHLSGGSVDLTLVDQNWKELDMWTEFDSFTPEASTFFYEIYNDKPTITNNRRILRNAMIEEWFSLDEDEWWHFDYGNQIWALKNWQSFAFYGEIK